MHICMKLTCVSFSKEGGNAPMITCCVCMCVRYYAHLCVVA